VLTNPGILGAHSLSKALAIALVKILPISSLSASDNCLLVAIMYIDKTILIFQSETYKIKTVADFISDTEEKDLALFGL
jgi:hypothetical protein